MSWLQKEQNANTTTEDCKVVYLYKDSQQETKLISNYICLKQLPVVNQDKDKIDDNDGNVNQVNELNIPKHFEVENSQKTIKLNLSNMINKEA